MTIEYRIMALKITHRENKATEYEECEAIPIEWLLKWEQKNQFEYESYFREIGKYPMECAIEDWRKENENV